MAEAAVDQRPNRFFCHQCSMEISPTMPEFTCPSCSGGFIEEMVEEQEEESPPEEVDPAEAFANIWRDALFGGLGLRMHIGQNHGIPAAHQAGGGESEEEDDEPSMARRERRSSFQRRRPRLPRRGERNMEMLGLLEGLLGNMTRSFPGGVPVMLNIHGNPGDYAWGPHGLDTIISQLLNQMEGQGSPPASEDQISSLPKVTIDQNHVDQGVQCSVCMEDYKVGEEVKRLPCQHMYHDDCIVPWLKLHGTCPVCRKTLEGKDTSTQEFDAMAQPPGRNPVPSTSSTASSSSVDADPTTPLSSSSPSSTQASTNRQAGASQSNNTPSSLYEDMECD